MSAPRFVLFRSTGWRLLLTISMIAVLVELAKRLSVQKILEAMINVHPGWFLLAVGSAALNLCLSADRSRRILLKTSKLLPVVKVTAIACIVNHLTLFMGGSIATKLVGFQRLGASPGSSVNAVGDEVLLDVVVTSVVTLTGFMLIGAGGFTGNPDVEQGMLTAAGFVCCAAVSIAASLRLRRKGRYAVQTVSGSSSSGTHLLQCLLLSFAIWITAAFSFFCLLRGSGQSVALWTTFIATCSGFLLSLATFLPGGLGVRDIAWSIICTNLTQIPMVATLAAALSLRLVSVLAACLFVVAIEAQRFSPLRRPPRDL